MYNQVVFNAFKNPLQRDNWVKNQLHPHKPFGLIGKSHELQIKICDKESRVFGLFLKLFLKIFNEDFFRVMLAGPGDVNIVTGDGLTRSSILE